MIPASAPIAYLKNHVPVSLLSCLHLDGVATVKHPPTPLDTSPRRPCCTTKILGESTVHPP